VHPDELIETMRHDKKVKGGRIRFVLPSCIGAVEVVEDIDESMVRAVLEEVVHGISY
jgi:3-dehydroquinate synthase